MDMPVIRRGDQSAMLLRGPTAEGVRFERIQAHGILWTVRFTKTIGEIDDGASR